MEVLQDAQARSLSDFFEGCVGFGTRRVTAGVTREVLSFRKKEEGDLIGMGEEGPATLTHKAGWDNDSTHTTCKSGCMVLRSGRAIRNSSTGWIVEVSRVGTISKQVRCIVMVEGAGPRGTGLALPRLCTAPGDKWLRVYLLAELRAGVG